MYCFVNCFKFYIYLKQPDKLAVSLINVEISSLGGTNLLSYCFSAPILIVGLRCVIFEDQLDLPINLFADSIGYAVNNDSLNFWGVCEQREFSEFFGELLLCHFPLKTVVTDWNHLDTLHGFRCLFNNWFCYFFLLWDSSSTSHCRAVYEEDDQVNKKL